MTLNEIFIRAKFETDAEARFYRYSSPDRVTVKGFRMRIGWMFFRIGAFVLYGNKGESTYHLIR